MMLQLTAINDFIQGFICDGLKCTEIFCVGLWTITGIEQSWHDSLIPRKKELHMAVRLMAANTWSSHVKQRMFKKDSIDNVVLTVEGNYKRHCTITVD